MRELALTEPTLSPRELLEMATVNGAAALGQQHALGKIRAGFAADLIGVPWHGRTSAVLDDVVSFGEKIPWLMVNGTVKAAA